MVALDVVVNEHIESRLNKLANVDANERTDRPWRFVQAIAGAGAFRCGITGDQTQPTKKIRVHASAESLIPIYCDPTPAS
jgi:hypothetical protein